MNNNKQFDVPILFIVFRRKDTALKVLEAIAKVKPKTLYISQDGPKNDEEKRNVQETRKAVLSKINWKCDLTIWGHDQNLGLKRHIPEAFNRFFEIEQYGIYLEDDALPSEDFFYFQKELLEKYKNDNRIFSINGTNFFPDKIKVKDSYFLSKIGRVWGIGLWKRSWRLYNDEMEDFYSLSRKESYNSYFFNKRYKYYLEIFWKAIIEGKLDSWAMKMIYTAIKNNMYFIIPKVNLVNNIGINNKASNMSLQSYYKDYGKIIPIKHPPKLSYRKEIDIIYFDNLLAGGWIRLWCIKLYLSSSKSLKNVIEFLMKKIFSK